MFARAVNSGFDGFGGTVQDGADFGMREFFVFGKNQGNAEFLGKSGDGLANGVGGFGGFNGLARVRGVVWERVGVSAMASRETVG